MNARGKHIAAAIDFLYSNATAAADVDANTATGANTMYQSPVLDADAVDAKTADSPNIAEAPTSLEMSLSADGELGVTLMEMAPLEFEEYSMAADGPPAIDGWMGATLSRRNNADECRTDRLCLHRHRGGNGKALQREVRLECVTCHDDGGYRRLTMRLQRGLSKLADSSSFPTLVTDQDQTFTNVPPADSRLVSRRPRHVYAVPAAVLTASCVVGVDPEGDADHNE